MTSLSIVVPCHNEEDSVSGFLARVTPVISKLGMSHEIIFVDDGSTDLTVDTLLDLKKKFPSIRVVELARNFGKEAALTAELSHASGRAVIPMDCDLREARGTPVGRMTIVDGAESKTLLGARMPNPFKASATNQPGYRV